MVSFVNERTVEYMVVPALVDILRNSFPVVVPFYFWASREGGRLSRTGGTMGPFRLLALFARRPKMESLGSEIVQLKINVELFRKAHYFGTVGIPTLAAFPCASSLVHLSLANHILWFKLHADLHGEDVCRNVRVADGTMLDSPFEGSDQVCELQPDKIPELIYNNSAANSWDEILGLIDGYRRYVAKPRRYSGRPLWFFDQGYKPVFFLLGDSAECIGGERHLARPHRS